MLKDMVKLVFADKIILKINFVYLFNYQAFSLRIINIEVGLSDNDMLELH
jgi:hypothetical protein